MCVAKTKMFGRVLVSDMHSFGMDRVHANILSNILFKNYCTESTPRSYKESRIKIMKLSDEKEN